MGQGIQQPPVEQGGASSAFLDVFKVLFEPGAVFERVRARPSFFAPFLTIIAVQCVLFFINLPYLKVALQAQMAAAPQARPVPSGALLTIFGLIGLILFLGLIFVVSGLLLWVLASVLGGGEAKFSTMLSVATYAAVPSAILLGIVGVIVLHMQGTSGITSTQDLQPALGLDLMAPGAKGFVGAVLKSINPFSIWGLVLTAIGVTTTQRVSKSTGYTVAISAFVIGVLIAGGLGAAFNR
jgi:hypothetical protein